MGTVGLVVLTALLGCAKGPRCEVDEGCAGDEICHYGHCTGALDRWWEVTIKEAVVGEVHPDGGAWDPDGGAPDLTVSFGLGTTDMCFTPTRIDTYGATWAHYCTFLLGPGDTLYVEVYDEDPESYDYGAGWSWEGRAALMDLFRERWQPVTSTDESRTISSTFVIAPDF